MTPDHPLPPTACHSIEPSPAPPTEVATGEPPVDQTPEPADRTVRVPDGALEQAALSYRDFRRTHAAADTQALECWAASLPSDCQAAATVIREVHEADPKAAEQLADAATAIPRVGQKFLGFRLVRELGRGAFARVFLARQGDLADRYVVLKVSADRRPESQTLAQLQHTNIVPIHSAHRVGPLQALCMPYFGSVTLADVYRDLSGMASLPNSGRGLVSTLNARKASTVRQSALPEGGEPGAAAEPPPPREPVSTLKMLEGLGYVEAVLWLAARLADGLAHAHERGIVHRDLKPANILLTDEGQPMLLDFNLAADSRVHGSPAAAGMGGTLPYMSPEQLEAFAGRKRFVDARSDLYSLGVILFELLTRRHPFPIQDRSSREAPARMLKDRLGPPPRLRDRNRLVSPAVEAIVRRCLEPDPARRYQSARELREDLERQLAHLPLRYTREPSARERFAKWRRRHPYLASTASLTAVAVLLFAGLGTAYVYRGERLARLEAADLRRQTGEEMRSAQVLLLDRNAGPGQLDEGIDLCRTALDRYRVFGNPSWRESPLVRKLPPGEQGRLGEDVGDLLFLMAKATSQRADRGLGRQTPDPRLEEAWQINAAALACYDRQPRAVWEQRAELARLLGRDEEAREAARKAEETPLRPDKDYFLLGHVLDTERNFRKALPLLRQATQRDPQNYIAWFVRGQCHLELLQDAEAVGCFNSCVALRPEFYRAWYNRGLAARRQRNFEQAAADFDRVVELQPGLALGYVNRALAREGLRDYPAAIVDLSRALELGAPATTVLFERAAVRAKAKDADGAKRDREEAMRRPPADEDGFVERGLARVEPDPKGALADFDEALRLNPASFRGLQNKAALLVDKFGKDEEALRVMDRAVELYPDSELARAGRGVLLARFGKRDKAIEEAQAALLLDTTPPTLYQVACVYALTSKQRAEDRLRAFELLASALRKGYGLDLIDQDTDLDPIRDTPEFRRLADGARALRGGR